MFGVSVLFGRATLYRWRAARRVARGPSRTIGRDPRPIHLDRATARRFLATRHLLAPPRSLPADPASVMHVMDRLGSLQFDPLEVTGRNHDLVLAARVAGYRRAWTDDLLYRDANLYETYNKGLSIVPDGRAAVVPGQLGPGARRARGAAVRRARATLVEELLDRIRRDGPLSSTDVSRGPRSTGTGARRTRSGRSSRRWPRPGSWASPGATATVASTTSPSACSRPTCSPSAGPSDDQRRHKLLSRYRAHGLLGRVGVTPSCGTARARDAGRRTPPDAAVARRAAGRARRGRRARPGRRGGRPRRAVRAVAARIGHRSRRSRRPTTRPAPPASRSWRRSTHSSGTATCCGRSTTSTTSGRSTSPRPKRRWGYYVLPLLYGDRLVGRIEPRVDRRSGVLRVLDLWWEDGFDPLASPGFVDAFADALSAHARFAGCESDRLAAPRAASGPRRAGPGSPRTGRPPQRRDGDRPPAAPVAGLVDAPGRGIRTCVRAPTTSASEVAVIVP